MTGGRVTNVRGMLRNSKTENAGHEGPRRANRGSILRPAAIGARVVVRWLGTHKTRGGQALNLRPTYRTERFGGCNPS